MYGAVGWGELTRFFAGCLGLTLDKLVNITMITVHDTWDLPFGND